MPLSRWAAALPAGAAPRPPTAEKPASATKDRFLGVPLGLTVPVLKVDATWDHVRRDAASKARLADRKHAAPWCTRGADRRRGAFPSARLERADGG